MVMALETLDLSTNVKYYGREEPLPVQRRLSAGPLSMVLEDGDLRYIRLGEREVLRRVYVAVRDSNWRTIQPSYTNVRLDIAPDAFHITLDADDAVGEIDVSRHVPLRGRVGGMIKAS